MCFNFQFKSLQSLKCRLCEIELQLIGIFVKHPPGSIKYFFNRKFEILMKFGKINSAAKLPINSLINYAEREICFKIHDENAWLIHKKILGKKLKSESLQLTQLIRTKWLQKVGNFTPPKLQTIENWMNFEFQ